MEIRVLSPTGQLGSGFLETSLRRGVSLRPHVIACDAGSTDPGPGHLGTGEPNFSHAGTKRDLRLLLKARAELDVPLIIGSCGTSGSDEGLAWIESIVDEIVREEALDVRIALISSEQDRPFLKRLLAEGRILPLEPAFEIDDGTIDNSAHIVAMMGHEPIAAAIAQGAQVVLAGRASDTALFAAVPLLLGAPAGPSWHAAKILECGAAAAVQRKRPDCMFAWIRDDHFVVEPMDGDVTCTPQSVASHTLYENSDPFLLHEPGGVIDTRHCVYEAISDRAVRVFGSAFLPAERYTVKLEGAELVGHRFAIIGGVRDPYILRQLDSWLAAMQARFAERVVEMFNGRITRDDYKIHARIYGRDGVMGKLETEADRMAHEVGILFTIVAREHEDARAIAKTFSHFSLHYPIPEWRGLITGLSYPLTPAEIDCGPVFRFNFNHVAVPDTPTQMFVTRHKTSTKDHVRHAETA